MLGVSFCESKEGNIMKLLCITIFMLMSASILSQQCESVVEIGLGKSTTYGRHFSCMRKPDSVSPLFSTLTIFNY